jgi:cytochrome b
VPRQISHGDEALSEHGSAKQLVWDLPTRLFHWLLAALIAFSWWTVHNHHTDWHIWSGCAILTLLIFRLLWGFVGSSTARFSNFVRGPRAIGAYLRGRWAGIGHNPLGAISVLALLGAVAIQVGLGLISEDEDGIYMGPLAGLVSTDTSDKARDIHELWFNVILALVALHLVAILYYRLRGKKP